MFFGLSPEMLTQQAKQEDDLKEWNNQIRREKFDIVLPEPCGRTMSICGSM